MYVGCYVNFFLFVQYKVAKGPGVVGGMMTNVRAGGQPTYHFAPQMVTIDVSKMITLIPQSVVLSFNL